MRLAVLLCGVLSGVVALGLGWWGQQAALLHVAGLSEPIRLAVVIAIQPIALASIAGGAAIMVFPAVSRAALLASAVGWLGLVAILGGGLTLPVAALIVLSATGGLLGFLPSVREPLFRLQRADAVDEEEEADRSRSRNSAALRYDLRDAISEPASPPAPPPQPQFPQPQALGQPRQVSSPPQPPPQQAPAPPRTLSFSSFDTMERPSVPPVEPQPEPLPTLGNIDAEDHSRPFTLPSQAEQGWQPYFPPPPTPTRPPELRPAAPRYDTSEDHSKPFVAPPYDTSEDHSRPFVPPPAETESPPTRAERQAGPKPFDFRRRGVPALREEKPVKRKGRRTRRRATAGIVALVLLVIGAPALLVLDAQLRGPQVLPAAAQTPSVAPSAARAASEEVAEARLPSGQFAPALASEASSAPASASAAPGGEFASLPPISALPSTPSSEMPVVAATAALPMALKGPPYASPFDYCTALGNADEPDESQITGGLPNAIVKDARAAAKLGDGDFHWRCMDKAVWTCVTAKGSPACKKVPNSVDRVLFCASHPDVQVTNSPAGDWGCDGFTPVVSKEQLNAVDRRGFDKRVWQPFAAPQQATAPNAG